MMLAMQSASLILTTTPPEELAAGLTSLLAPLRLLGVSVKEIGAPKSTPRCSWICKNQTLLGLSTNRSSYRESTA